MTHEASVMCGSLPAWFVRGVEAPLRYLMSPLWGLRVAEIAFDSAEPVFRLPEQPLDHALVVVAPGKDVVQRREAALLALLLHFFQLRGVELVILNGAPVVSRGVHGEARRERAIHAHDQRIVSGAASPVVQVAVDEVLHLCQALY